jgi:hypothetical protein
MHWFDDLAEIVWFGVAGTLVLGLGVAAYMALHTIFIAIFGVASSVTGQ